MDVFPQSPQLKKCHGKKFLNHSGLLVNKSPSGSGYVNVFCCALHNDFRVSEGLPKNLSEARKAVFHKAGLAKLGRRKTGRSAEGRSKRVAVFGLDESRRFPGASALDQLADPGDALLDRSLSPLASTLSRSRGSVFDDRRLKRQSAKARLSPSVSSAARPRAPAPRGPGPPPRPGPRGGS